MLDTSVQLPNPVTYVAVSLNYLLGMFAFISIQGQRCMLIGHVDVLYKIECTPLLVTTLPPTAQRRNQKQAYSSEVGCSGVLNTDLGFPGLIWEATAQVGKLPPHMVGCGSIHTPNGLHKRRHDIDNTIR